jgi:methylglutamate dehydrogenase subunit D
MPDFQSPLAAVRRPGRYGATFDAGPAVTLSDAPLDGLVQIAGWHGFETAVLPVLKSLGFTDAGDYHSSRQSGDMTLYRTAPDRILITGKAARSLVETAGVNAELALLDLSHARVQIFIEGRAAEQLMAQLAPIDFRLNAMPVGFFVQTGIHHIGVQIHRSSETRFDLLVPVTFARSLWDFIMLNAAPFGYDVAEAA